MKLWVLLALGAGLSAGASEPTRPAEGIAPPKRLPDPVVRDMVVPPAEPVSTTALPRELRRVVVADAAKHLNVPESSVVLTHAEQVTWPDGSLGCPRAGMSYTQALVPGFRVVARSVERQLVYHTDSRGNAVRCDQPIPLRGQRPADGAPGNDAQPRTQPPTPVAPDR
jgi:hypothetical protein